MRRASPIGWWVVAALAAVCAAPAQEVQNGEFDNGLTHWNTAYGLPYASTWDINGDSDNELVLEGTLVTNQYTGVVAVQDLGAAWINLAHGIALAGDTVALSLPSTADLRAFLKLEFLDASSNHIPNTTLSAEYDPSKYATGSQSRAQVVLVKHYRDLQSQLAGEGLTLDDVGYVRAGCLLFRFDTNKTLGNGFAHFDNVSLGLVSRSYDDPQLVNGGLEYNEWGWLESPMSATVGVQTIDFNGDGDKELVFEGTGLDAQGAGRLWVQEMDATVIDFTQGLSFVTDLGASNLTTGIKVFHKIEFSTNGPPYGGGVVLSDVHVSSEYDPLLHASNNDIRVGSTITMDYATLTNALNPKGLTPDDLTFVRFILFVLQFDASPPAGAGFGWFDNARAVFEYRDRPDASGASFADRSSVVLTWPSDTNSSYRIERIHDLADYRWSNIVTGVAGGDGQTSCTNALVGDAGFLRVVRQ